MLEASYFRVLKMSQSTEIGILFLLPTDAYCEA